jgi:methylenetetrahydrofolate reductase (NADPH)
MRLSDIYGPGKFGLSYELFPPRTDAGMQDLWTNLTELVTFEVSYVTCTYGAGGSTRDKTLFVAERVHREFGVPVASHLTCVGATVDDLRAYLCEAGRRGVDYIVAVRGDPPKGETVFKPVVGGFSHPNELVALIRAEFSFLGVIVAGYPETHREAPSPEADLDNLRRKVDAGADVVITQLFYKNADFFRFRDRCAAKDITLPIVPGILPVTNLGQIKRVADLCGAALPREFLARLEAHAEDPEGQFAVGVYHAARQVEELVEAGVPGVHFYVLNKSRATAHVLRALVLPPRTPKDLTLSTAPAS